MLYFAAKRLESHSPSTLLSRRTTATATATTTTTTTTTIIGSTAAASYPESQWTVDTANINVLATRYLLLAPRYLTVLLNLLSLFSPPKI